MKVLFVSDQDWSIDGGPFGILAREGVEFRRIALSNLRRESGHSALRKVQRYLPGPEVTRPIRSAVSEFGPDIIHLDGRRTTGLAVVAALRGRAQPPMILEHGAIGGLNVLSPFDWRTYFNRRIDKLVVPSHAMVNNWLGNQLLRRCIGAHRCAVVPLHVHLPPLLDGTQRRELRRSLGLADDAFVIGTVCNVRPVKNLTFVADVVRRLGGNFVFAVVGKIQAKGEEEQLRRAGGNALRLLGPIPNARTIMVAFDVYVTPTRPGGEGFGVAQVEAMASAVPVLAMNFGGAAETIEHGLSGFALPYDACYWSAAIKRLAGDAELRERVGRHARERAATRFSAAAVANQWMMLYRATAEGKA